MKKKPLIILPIQTPLFKLGESLVDFILESLIDEKIEEGTVIAVTSKIASLAERRLVPFGSIDKKTLIQSEADHYFGEIGYGCHLTIKHGLFIASAGIDESNSEGGDYILYPEDPFATAEILWRELRKFWKVDHLGVLLTDSHTTPLRKGVTGISLAHWGFKAVRDMVGSPDLFGRPLKMTTVNVADALAASAVYAMGEGAESQPLALIGGAAVQFTTQTHPSEIRIPLNDDLYLPYLKNVIC